MLRGMNARKLENLPTFWFCPQVFYDFSFLGWRIYANTRNPVVKLTPDLDLNEVKQEMGDFAKLSVNDDLKIDWDDKKLVVFHFFRNEGETCTIRVWDIENEPRFEYFIDKGTEYITDKVFVHDGHIVVGMLV